MIYSPARAWTRKKWMERKGGVEAAGEAEFGEEDDGGGAEQGLLPPWISRGVSSDEHRGRVEILSRGNGRWGA